MNRLLPVILLATTALATFVPLCTSSEKLNSGENEKWDPLLDWHLSKWELWMGVPHPSVKDLPTGTPTAEKPQGGTPLGLDNDPKDVFSIVRQNNEPILKITGEIYGGLTTLKEYQNYHFSAEVKWGEQKWEPRLDRKRDSGFLYHCVGPHGAFWNVWMRCVEFQIQEGDFGDLFMLAGTGGTVRVSENQNPIKGQAQYRWDSSQPYIKKGRVQIASDQESPHGNWTHIEVYTFGDKAIHMVNGEVVLAIKDIRQRDIDGPLTKGKLQIQSEGAEVYYRDIKIRPIKKFPNALSQAANF